MVTLEALRPALLSDRPWSGLDGLVRSEIARGRRVRDILNEFRALVEPARDSLPLSDDADDALMDTLDALAGNCSPKWLYHDSPDTPPPTEEEVTLLPTWARVAFAARCAKRVVGLFSRTWAGAPDRPAVLRRVVRFSEESAALARVSDGFVGITIEIDRQVGAPLVEAVSRTVYHAATAANFMVYESTSDALAAQAAGEALAGIGIAHPFHPVRRDFDHVLRMSDWLHWAGDTAVPPDVFGPLWPEGAPAGWPADPDVQPRDELVAAAIVKDDVPTRHVRDELLNVFRAVNRYYIARTGQRLTLEGDMPLLLAALVPEGSAT